MLCPSQLAHQLERWVRGIRRTAALLVSALQGSGSGEDCGVEGEGRTTPQTTTCLRIQDSVRQTWSSPSMVAARLPEAASLLAFQWYNCTSLLPGRASLLLLQQLQGFVPFPDLQVGRKTSHPRETKNFVCHVPPQGCSTQVCQRGQTGNGRGEMIAAQWRQECLEH